MRRCARRYASRAAVWAAILSAVSASLVQGQTVSIQGGTVHTGTQPPMANATVVIVDGRIVAVGRNVTTPQGARIVDASGKIVTAGLFDAFTGLGITEIGLESETVDGSFNSDRITAGFNVEDGLNPNSTLIPITRVEGITRAIVAPQGFSGLITGQGILVNLGGAQHADMVDRSPVAMFVRLGAAGAASAGGSRAGATMLLREALQDARDFAGNREAYHGGRRRDYAVSRLDLEALVPVVQRRLPLVIQANRASDILAALRIAGEFDLDIVVSGALEGWMVAEELATANVPVIVTALTNLPGFDGLGSTYENAARLHAAGVPVALSAFDAHNVRNIRQTAGNAVAHGMPHEAALRAITVTPAEIFGFSDAYGTLEPGKDADVVVWSGDPLELTSYAERVYVRGILQPTDTRQRALFERYRDLSRAPRR